MGPSLGDRINSLLDVAVRSRLPFDTVAEAVDALTGVGLLVDDGVTADVAGEAP